MSVLSQPFFHDETAAYVLLESALWPTGPACPHCGATDRIGKMAGAAHRIGLYKCYHCRGQFTVKVGTVFESSHVPLHKWLQAFYLICSSKKSISSHQLHRVLEVTYKTAWFMSHRIREAMRDGRMDPLGGLGKVVEADETYYGRRDDDPEAAESGPASSVPWLPWWSAAAPSAPSTSSVPIRRPCARS